MSFCTDSSSSRDLDGHVSIPRIIRGYFVPTWPSNNIFTGCTVLLACRSIPTSTAALVTAVLWSGPCVPFRRLMRALTKAYRYSSYGTLYEIADSIVMLTWMLRILESLYVAFQFRTLYYYAVTNFMNPLALTREPWCVVYLLVWSGSLLLNVALWLRSWAVAVIVGVCVTCAVEGADTDIYEQGLYWGHRHIVRHIKETPQSSATLISGTSHTAFLHTEFISVRIQHTIYYLQTTHRKD